MFFTAFPNKNVNLLPALLFLQQNINRHCKLYLLCTEVVMLYLGSEQEMRKTEFLQAHVAVHLSTYGPFCRKRERYQVEIKLIKVELEHKSSRSSN